MKIWFDLSNAPHINLFKNLLLELEFEGHEIIVTCRPLSNTISLLELHKIRYSIVGKHYGKNLIRKIMGYPIRVLQLQNFIRPLKVDVAISQSSFHSPVAARMLGIPSIYMNDNEHALGNIPSFICANRILIPEFLNIDKVKKQGAKIKKISVYPGVKEGIYLWQPYLKNGHLKNSNASVRNIYIRPEPHTAQYYRGGLNFLDEVIQTLKGKYNIVILTRDEDQFKYYKSPKFDGVTVPDKSSDVEEIAKKCLLFIGAGGTMTREMAVIGIPTISVYQDKLLDVDKYLITQGLMLHLPEIRPQNVIDYLNQNFSKPPDTNLLLKGRESYYLIKNLIKQIGTK